MIKARPLILLWHRYVGLATAGFLILAGLTGAILAFAPELDRLLNADLHDRSFAAPELTAVELRAAAARAYPDHDAPSLNLRRAPGEPAFQDLTPRPGVAADTALQGVYLDPATGEVLAEKRVALSLFDPRTAVHFLVHLHYRLLLPEVIGMWVMGCVAILWLIDHVAAFILIAPNRKALAKAFRIRLGQGSYKFNFDLHRATGAWLLSLTMVLALTSVDFNLGNEVTRPLVRLLSPGSATEPALGPVPAGRTVSPMGWDPVLAHARALVAAKAREEGFSVNWEQYLSYDPVSDSYRLQFHTSLDIVEPTYCCGRTAVTFDGTSGAVIAWERPLGTTNGDAFLAWLPALHVGSLFGWPHRILLCLLGLATATMAVTGVLIWSRKRQQRVQRPPRAARRSSGAGLSGA